MRNAALITAAIAATATTAHGAFVQLDREILLRHDAEVSVSLVGAWAGAAGDVYFLGAAPAGGELIASADTAEPALGQRLFNSKDTPGATADLGYFEGGTRLHFAYHITKGAGDLVRKGDVFRSDAQKDQIQLGWDPDASTDALYRIGWEDIRDPKRSDWDYADVVFDVHTTPARGEPVPTPGTMTILAVTAGAAAARRRR